MKFNKTFDIDQDGNIYTYKTEKNSYEIYRARTWKNNGTSKADGNWLVQINGRLDENSSFKTLKEARVSSQKIFDMYLDYRIQKDFVGMDMCRKFLEMGFTRARRYANHKDGKKYDKDGKVLPQEKDWATSEKAKSAKRFKEFRDLVTQDEFYISMRKEWRDKENVRRV